MERTSKTDPISTIGKRYFGGDYESCLPCISDNQKLICMPRFNPSDETNVEKIIDVFDCS